MEFLQQNTQSQIALAVLSSNDNNDDKVYKSTTVPINNNRGEVLKNDRSQSTNNRDGSGENGVHRQPQFSNLPSREPIDLQFKDVAYTVNLGFRKGMNFYNLISAVQIIISNEMVMRNSLQCT